MKKSQKKCHKTFGSQFASVSFPSKSTLYELENKIKKKKVSYFGRCKTDTICMFFQNKHYMLLECVPKHVQENL
jgi:hypothetical protein